MLGRFQLFVRAFEIPHYQLSVSKTWVMSELTPDTTPDRTPGTLTVKEVADRLGKHPKTIERWCQNDTFKQAEKVKGNKGDEWSISPDDLELVAKAKGLAVVDLTGDVPTVSVHVSELLEAKDEAADLREQVGQLSGQNEQLARSNDRLGSDNDHLRAEYERTNAQLAESERARGVLEGENNEKAKRLEEAAQESDSLDQKYRQLENESAESLSDLSTRLAASQNDVSSTAGERDELAAKLAEAEASMGWWTRRRYTKR